MTGKGKLNSNRAEQATLTQRDNQLTGREGDNLSKAKMSSNDMKAERTISYNEE